MPLVAIHGLWENRCINHVTVNFFTLQMAFMLLWVCSVIGHIKCQHVVRTWVIVKKSYPKNLSAYCWSTVDRQSADRCFGGLFFTITRTWMTHSLNGSLCNIFVCYTFWHDLLSITEQTCHRGIYLLMSIVLCDLQMKIWRMAKRVYWIQLSTQHACFHECKIVIQDIFFA